MFLIKNFIFLFKRGDFEYVDATQPEIHSDCLLIESNKCYKDQLLFETKETNMYTHAAINKNSLEDAGVVIRKDNNKPNNSLFLVLFCANNIDIYGYCGVAIKFKWEYINYFREKYLNAVKIFLKSVSPKDIKKFYDILTENLSDEERLYLDLC